MNKYLIPGLNADVEITTPVIKMTGHAGATLEDDISTGGFFVDLVLTVGAIVSVGVRVSNSASQPEDTTSLESIKAWAIAQLEEQYGIE